MSGNQLLDRKAEKHIFFSLLFLTLASATIFSCLIVIVCYVFSVTIFDIGINNMVIKIKKYFGWVVFFLITWGYLGFVFSQVAAEGKPLFGYQNLNFFQAIPISFAKMFTSNPFREQVLLVSVFLLLLSGLVVNIKHMEKIPFTVMLLLLFTITYGVAFLTHKPLPTDRVLLPFYPILVLAVIENLTEVLMYVKNISGLLKIINVSTVIVIILFLLNFFLSIRLTYTTDWRSNYPIRDMTYRYLIYGDDSVREFENNPVFPFYMDKIHMLNSVEP